MAANAVRQQRNPRSAKINMSRVVRPYSTRHCRTSSRCRQAGLKWTGHRGPGEARPFKILADNGEEMLVSQLTELDIEHLRDIVSQFGMDPRRLVMKWKEPQRVREHIVATTVQRSRKGDAFRA